MGSGSAWPAGGGFITSATTTEILPRSYAVVSRGRAPTQGTNLPPIMDCLVTGGAGFIGSNLVDALVQRGDRVAVLDTLVTGKRENLIGAMERDAELFEIDVRDRAAVHDVFADTRPEVV